MSDDSHLGRLSRLLFGSSYRLPVAAAIAQGPEEGIYVRALAEQLGVADNLVSGEVRRFRDAGVLEEMRGKVSGRRRTVYRRVPNPFWTAALELARGASSNAPSIVERLRAGESENFEVKDSLEARSGTDDAHVVDALMRTIVGFLNGNGGTILIGVTEDAQPHRGEADASRIGSWAVSGLRDHTFLERGWDAWTRKIYDAAFTRIVPAPLHLVAIERVDLLGHELAAINVQPSSEIFFVKDPHGVPQYVVRQADRDVKLNGPEMARHWAERARLVRKNQPRGTIGVTRGVDTATVTYTDESGVHTETIAAELARQIIEDRQRD